MRRKYGPGHFKNGPDIYSKQSHPIQKCSFVVVYYLNQANLKYIK